MSVEASKIDDFIQCSSGEKVFQYLSVPTRTFVYTFFLSVTFLSLQFLTNWQIEATIREWIEVSMTQSFNFPFWQIFFQFLGPLDLAYQTLAFSPIHKLELWRFFTYALLHAGPAHLVINIILQLVISLPLESEVGLMNLVFVYIFGIFSGSLAASISADFSLMVGASSGIYSLLMSHIPHIYMVSWSCLKL